MLSIESFDVGITFVLTMWMSNTATAIAMIPNTVEIVRKMKKIIPEEYKIDMDRYGKGLILSIALTCSLAGATTVISTPPNAILVATMSKAFPDLPEISFTKWLGIGLPVSVILTGSMLAFMKLCFVTKRLKEVR